MPGNPAFKKSFVFSAIRDEKEMAPDFHNLNPARSALIGKFPFLCCEIGGGMPSAYLKRVKVEPDEIAAMALAKLGSGNNMPGYYMYQGGVNPEGRLSYLNEAAPNAMPVSSVESVNSPAPQVKSEMSPSSEGAPRSSLYAA